MATPYIVEEIFIDAVRGNDEILVQRLLNASEKILERLDGQVLSDSLLETTAVGGNTKILSPELRVTDAVLETPS